MLGRRHPLRRRHDRRRTARRSRPATRPGPRHRLRVRGLRVRSQPLSTGTASTIRPEPSSADDSAGADLVSVAELAALAHLPTDVTVAGLARAGAKAVAPPPEVALLPNPEAAKVLGDAETGGHRPVALAARRRPPPPPRHGRHRVGQVDPAHQPRPRRHRRRPGRGRHRPEGRPDYRICANGCPKAPKPASCSSTPKSTRPRRC